MSARHRAAAAPPASRWRGYPPQFRALALLAALLAGSPCAWCIQRPRPPAGAEGLERFFAQQVPSRLERYGAAGLSLAVVSEGKPLLAAGYGLAARGTRAPMTADTPVPTGLPGLADGASRASARELAGLLLSGLGSAAGYHVETLADGTRALTGHSLGKDSAVMVVLLPESGEGIAILQSGRGGMELICELVTAWAGWAGVAVPGLVRTLSLVCSAARVASLALTVVAGVLLLRLFYLLLEGRRRWAPPRGWPGWLVLLLWLPALGVPALWWATGFPLLRSWLPSLRVLPGVTLTFLGVLLGLGLLFPAARSGPR
jgi:hypothetical protein